MPNDAEIELLPCPFCGNVRIKLEKAVGEYWVECYSCSASHRLSSTAEEAIKAWNTRHPQQANELPKSNHDEMCGVHDGMCHVCDVLTSSYGANPSLWSIYLPHIDGQRKHRFYHIKCLYPILKELPTLPDRERLAKILAQRDIPSKTWDDWSLNQQNWYLKEAEAIVKSLNSNGKDGV